MFDRTDRYVGLGFVGLGAFFFYISTTWKPNYTADPAGPAAIPKILCVGLIILGAILAVGGFRVREKAEKAFCTRDELVIVGALTAICILYINLLPLIGYLLATPLLIGSILVTVGCRKPKTVVLISVIATIVLFLLFYSLLQVNLPLAFMRKFISSVVPRLQ